MVIILMGVSGSGKTTLGQLLSAELGWNFYDADDFHSQGNIEKMRSGIPLTDDDRIPWLKTLKTRLDQWLAQGENAILACSALKASYRQILGEDSPAVKYVYLQGSHAEILQRLQQRQNHFMPQKLLKSQFSALEEPQNCLRINISQTPQQIVLQIREKLNL